MTDLHWHKREARIYERPTQESFQKGEKEEKDLCHHDHHGPVTQIPETAERRNEMLLSLDKMTVQEMAANAPRDYIGSERLEVISVPPFASLPRLFKILSTHHISCLPVIEAAATARGGVLRGLIDVLDITVFLAQQIGSKRPVALDEKEVLAANASSMIDNSHKNSLHPVQEGSSLSEALDAFAKGIHRLPVFDRQGMLCALVSQSDVVRTINAKFNAGVAVGMASRSVQQYRSALREAKHWGGPEQVKWIAPDASMADALAAMASSGLTALAVVENGSQVGPRTSGRLVSHLSLLWELPLMAPTRMHTMSYWLNKTVESFLDAYAENIKPPVCVLPDVTLADACRALVDNRVHHIWVVEDHKSMRPLGVISLSDICCIINHFQWPSWL